MLITGYHLYFTNYKEGSLLSLTLFRFNTTDEDFEEPIAYIGIVGSKEEEKDLEWQRDHEGRVCCILLFLFNLSHPGM